MAAPAAGAAAAAAAASSSSAAPFRNWLANLKLPHVDFASDYETGPDGAGAALSKSAMAKAITQAKTAAGVSLAGDAVAEDKDTNENEEENGQLELADYSRMARVAIFALMDDRGVLAFPPPICGVIMDYVADYASLEKQQVFEANALFTPALPNCLWRGVLRADNAMKNDAFRVAIEQNRAQFRTMFPDDWLRGLEQCQTRLTRPHLPGHWTDDAFLARENEKRNVQVREKVALISDTWACANPCLAVQLKYLDTKDEEEDLFELRFDDHHYAPWHIGFMLSKRVLMREAIRLANGSETPKKSRVFTCKVGGHRVMNACRAQDLTFKARFSLKWAGHTVFGVAIRCVSLRKERNESKPSGKKEDEFKKEGEFNLNVIVPLIIKLPMHAASTDKPKQKDVAVGAKRKHEHDRARLTIFSDDEDDEADNLKLKERAAALRQRRA